jgi:hypothetical protein
MMIYLPRNNNLKFAWMVVVKQLVPHFQKLVCCTINNKSSLGTNFFPSNSEIAHTQEVGYTQHNLN